jgi:hypothetical protein
VGAKAPEHLKVRQHVAGRSQTHDYQLIESRWCENCDALPPDAQPVPALEADLASIMVAASEGMFEPLSSEDYLRRIDAALDRGAALEAVLWFLERQLQDGTQRCQPGDTSEGCRVQNRVFELVQLSEREGLISLRAPIQGILRSVPRIMESRLSLACTSPKRCRRSDTHTEHADTLDRGGNRHRCIS